MITFQPCLAERERERWKEKLCDERTSEQNRGNLAPRRRLVASITAPLRPDATASTTSVQPQKSSTARWAQPSFRSSFFSFLSSRLLTRKRQRNRTHRMVFIVQTRSTFFSYRKLSRDDKNNRSEMTSCFFSFKGALWEIIFLLNEY